MTRLNRFSGCRASRKVDQSKTERGRGSPMSAAFAVASGKISQAGRCERIVLRDDQKYKIHCAWGVLSSGSVQLTSGMLRPALFKYVCFQLLVRLFNDDCSGLLIGGYSRSKGFVDNPTAGS